MGIRIRIKIAELRVLEMRLEKRSSNHCLRG